MPPSKQDQHTMDTPVHDPEVPTLQDIYNIIAQELQHLWADLVYAMKRTQEWNQECQSIEKRIKRLTPLTGPTPWQQVHIRLLEFGMYQRIHEDIGITVYIDFDKVAEARAMLEDQKNKQHPHTPSHREATS